MRLPGAYRCLPRPSSVPDPSHPPTGVGVSDPVSIKPSLVPETLEPMHGGNRKASSPSPCSALRWQSFLPSCICELYGIGLGITFMYGWGQRVYLRR
jgi:hypothetical protein